MGTQRCVSRRTTVVAPTNRMGRRPQKALWEITPLKQQCEEVDDGRLRYAMNKTDPATLGDKKGNMPPQKN